MEEQQFPLMTADEVAELLNVHRETVLRWAREGQLHGYKVGTRWRFSAQNVQRFLGQRRFPGPNG